jgi:hypothetical protein
MKERNKKETNQLKREKQNRSSKPKGCKKRNRKAYSKPNKTV